ncbi:MAG: hypothetical protein HOM41_03765 [Flavobacteriales bacterium]|jgi:hypothetical protein|nr:hypothetical protein [Flavobacteriales bacterium]
MEAFVALILFVIGFIVARKFEPKIKYLGWLKLIKIAENKFFLKRARKQNERAMHVRDHTMRLNEVTFLLSKLREYDNDTETINTFIERIGVSIDKLNIAIASGNEAWAGSLLTTFSRHLREILNESATNQIEFSTCTTHVEHLLSLLSSINKNSWSFEISDHKIFEMDNSRFIRSLAIMPWVADILWEAVINDKPIDYVGIEISSDSYEATYTIKFEGKEMKRSLPFIEGIRENEE